MCSGGSECDEAFAVCLATTPHREGEAPGMQSGCDVVVAAGGVLSRFSLKWAKTTADTFVHTSLSLTALLFSRAGSTCARVDAMNAGRNVHLATP